MVKKVTLILSLISICAFWRGSSMFPDAAAQQAPGSTRPGRTSARGTSKKINYSKFLHSSHAGMVGGVLRQAKSQELKCDYCHLNPTAEQPVVTGYPNLKPGGSTLTHSACIECHLMNTRPEYPDMCLICHSTKPLAEMKKNIRVFPNPASGPNSQFYDYYSHSDHAGYFKSSKTFKELFKDKNKYKEKDNFECAACHDENPQPVTVGGVQFVKGIKERAPGHKECFVCHFNEKEVDKTSKTFATNCVGCHNLDKKEKGMGSELAVLWFNREIVNTEFNPAKPPQKSGQKPKPPAPFNHEAHMGDYDDNPGGVFGTVKKPFSQGTQSCMICHETGKTAKTRSEFFNEFKKTMNKQPSAASCIPCHKAEMQMKIGEAVTLESAKCNFCHSLQTIKTRSAKGVELPPPSHFRLDTIAKLTPTTPAPTPPTPVQPQPTQEQTQPAQEITKPDTETVATAIPPTPTPRPDPAKNDTTPPAETAKPPATSETAPPPAPPTPAPAPTPAPTGAVKPAPTGIIIMGDPKVSDQWGQHSKWGIVENFNHGDHTKPKYSANCKECHHTNQKDNADGEVVQRCLDCHQSPDSPVTANKGGGVSCEDAYHGVPDSEKVPKAGCIECHKRYRDEKDPNSKAPVKSPCSGCHTEKTARLDPRFTRPRRDDWVTNNIAALTKWMRSSRAPAMALTR